MNVIDCAQYKRINQHTIIIIIIQQLGMSLPIFHALSILKGRAEGKGEKVLNLEYTRYQIMCAFLKVLYIPLTLC